MDAQTCREACQTLNLPGTYMQILGYNLCYKDSLGNCYQDGEEKWARNRAGVSLICKKTGKLL